jgi:hypothetical protein
MSFNLYDPGLDEDTTKKGPSHVSYNFPTVSGLAIIRSTKCTGLIFFSTSYFSVSPLDRLSLVFIDVVYCLKSDPFYSVFYYFCKHLCPLPKLESLLIMFLLLPVLLLHPQIKA